MIPLHAANILAAEEEDRLEGIRLENIERRIMRTESDPFSMEETRFKELFRLNKDMSRYVYNGILPHLDQKEIPNILKFFATLAFYATGSYQRVLGRSFDLSMSQQSVSRAIEEVTVAIVNTFADEWIRFPRTEIERNEVKRRFMEARNFPGVIGAIDCTHIELLTPATEEHNYMNRKGYHSKNIQIVSSSCMPIMICDHDLKILNVNGRYGGATHDSFIWRNSAVREVLERNYQRGDRSYWLLGDSGYPQEPWLMTPIGNAVEGSPESRYTAAHIQTRNCVERCIGVLKGRFLCLSKILRYSPNKVGNIANACAILHNICINAEVEMDFELPRPEEDIDRIPFLPIENRAGVLARRNLIVRYFTNM